jgi:hypothetical protein
VRIRPEKICTTTFLTAILPRPEVVQNSVVPTVHQETEMWQEVQADDGMQDVGHHEPPREFSA